MKKKLIKKCFLTLGLLLFFTLLIPSYNTQTALAGSIDKEKNGDYKLNLKSLPLVKGKDFTLKVYNLKDNSKISFKSEDSEIASVNDDGVVYGKKVGSTTITAIVKDGSNSTSLTCDVEVGPPAFSVKITKSRVILGISNTDQLRVILKPLNTTEEARYSSYDSSIASVSINGRVTGKSFGLTYLFAEIDAKDDDGNHKYSACPVIIVDSDVVSDLEAYFDKHPELDLVSEADLNSALDKFFNSDTARKYSNSNLVDALNKYLDNKFDLSQLRKARGAVISKSSVDQSEVVSDNQTIITNK